MHIAGRHSLLLGTRWRVVLAALVCLPILSGVGLGTASAATGVSTTTTKATWTKGTTLTASGGGVDAVSCPTSTFCAAVDHTGAVSYFNGTSWTVPLIIDGTNPLIAVACPSSTFCVATDSVGQYVVMNNGTWGAPTVFDQLDGLSMRSVSCSSASFCMAVGVTSTFTPIDYYYYNGVWTFDTVNLGPTDANAFSSVSCTSTNVCLASDVGGNVTTFTLATSPTITFTHSTVQINPTTKGFIADSISCVSSVSCVVGSGSNQVSTLTGTTWTTVSPFPVGALGVQVSCTATTCFANDSNAQAVSSPVPFSTWSTPGTFSSPSQINGLSCYSLAVGAACQAIDFNGYSITISLGVKGVPSYAPATTVFDPPHTLNSVSCASTTYCIAVDSAGEAMTYRGGAWSTPKVITTEPLGAREIRCGASAHPYTKLLCAGIFGDYGAFDLHSSASAWTPLTNTVGITYAISCSNSCEYLSPEGRSSGLVGGYLPKIPTSAIATDVSCPAGQSNCIAIDSSGNSYVSRGAQWYLGPRVQTSTSQLLWALSCTSMSFCVAIDLSGHAYTYNGTRWSSVAKISPLGLYAVSCGATYFCVASDLFGGSYIFNGSKWLKSTVSSGRGALHGLSCASASSCVAVDASHAYRLAISTDKTKISFARATPAQSEVGRTVVLVTVSAASAPTGTVTLSARSESCTATLKRLSALKSTAHCTVKTSHAGLYTFSAVFAGSYGFAATGPTLHNEMIIAKK
jgi:hypothetical protein